MGRNYIYLDCETTGVNINEDRIVSLYLRDTFGKELELFCNPKRPIHPEATAVHGFTDEVVQKFETFEQQKHKVEQYFKDRPNFVISGYNILRFDIPVILQELDRVESKLNILNYKFEDVYLTELKLNDNKLTSVYKRYTGKNLDDAHDAKADVLATEEVHRHQLLNSEYDPSFGEPEDYDLEGKFLQDENGFPIWNFGKWKGESVFNHLDYLKWWFSTQPPKYIENKIREDYKRFLKKNKNDNNTIRN